jgi:hypothetical protein
MSEEIKHFFEAKARAGDGSFAIAYVLLCLVQGQTKGGTGSAPGRAQPRSPYPEDDDATVQLMKLGMLRDQGILTDDEFQDQKDRILSTLD